MIKDYEQLLYNILKPLVTGSDPIKLYKNVITEDYNSQPHDFVVYTAEISNTPRVYGDGKVIVRSCNCDITVNEQGTGNYTESGYLAKKVEELLNKNNISYVKRHLGYIENMDSVQWNFEFYLR